MNLILFGAPGAGKGTQSALLVEKKGYVQISTGDLFRAAIKNQTQLGKEAQGYMDKGQLVPDAIVVGMVKEALKNIQGRPFILDGFPRTLAQAKSLDEMLKENNWKMDWVISLEVPRADLLERLTGRRVCKNCGAVYHVKAKPTRVDGVCDNCGGPVIQRNDDKADVIDNRLSTYLESTAPLKDYYREQGKLQEFDGNRSAEAVFNDLLGFIDR